MLYRYTSQPFDIKNDIYEVGPYQLEVELEALEIGFALSTQSPTFMFGRLDGVINLQKAIVGAQFVPDERR